MKLRRLKNEWLALQVAVQFLSCLPVPLKSKVTPALWAQSLVWYPAVGLIIGGLSWLLSWLLPDQLPVLLTASITVALWVFLTGALHLDGWADCVDAWVGGLGSRQRTLDIMKDPRSGPMAVVALILLLLMQVCALTAVLQINSPVWWLIPLLARVLILLAFMTVPYVRAQGLGTILAEQLHRRNVGVAILINIVLLWILLPLTMWFGWLLAAGGLFLVWRTMVLKRLQGFTGDCVGALVALAEVLLLVVSAVMLYQ